MTNKEIMEYAIKGINNEISELEKSYRTGTRILNDRYHNKFDDKSPMTNSEIETKMNEILEKITELTFKVDKLEWDLLEA